MKDDPSDNFSKPSRSVEEFTAKQLYISQTLVSQNLANSNKTVKLHGRKILFFALTNITFIIIFVFITVGSSAHWYRQGSGRSYAILRAQGVENSLAAAQSHTSGILYSAFSVCGLNIPLLLLLSTSLAIVFFSKDVTYKAVRWLLFVSICVFGSASLAVAQNILSHGVSPLISIFISTTFIWTGIALCFLTCIGIASLVRYFLKK